MGRGPERRSEVITACPGAPHSCKLYANPGGPRAHTSPVQGPACASFGERRPETAPAAKGGLAGSADRPAGNRHQRAKVSSAPADSAPSSPRKAQPRSAGGAEEVRLDLETVVPGQGMGPLPRLP